MKLTHIGISNFRSIGEDFVSIDLGKKINVLVGANNCGKSNVLRAIHRLNKGNIGRAFTKEDFHGLSEDKKPVFRCEAILPLPDQQGERRETQGRFDWIIEPNGLHCVATGWDSLDFRSFNAVRTELKNQSYGPAVHGEDLRNLMRDTGNEFMRRLVHDHIPTIVIVPQFREIVPAEKYSIAGQGVVKLLAAWDRPKFGNHNDSEKIRKVQELLRALLKEPKVALQVTHAHDQIIVVNNGLFLPLDSYGTGIHELIILAIAVLSHDNALVCIEEPEIHLHPLLQRRFLDFLRRETTNRYVITTHSPALIVPHDDTAVTHLWLENGVTKSRLVETTNHSLGALHDLGAKASDILQANSVIWVEGPSDRIYLRHWLELLHPGQFREGIDYTIMFYGGRLLSHVSLAREDAEPEEDTEDADDLVHLLRINQHSAIVIDSDRRKSTDGLNATKLRVQEQCTASNILCWITDGREIENYLPASVLKATYAELSGGTPEIKLLPFGSIEEALKKALKKSWPRSHYYDQAKPKMARLVSARMTKDHLTPEIIAWMEKLVRVIRHETP